MEIAAHVDELRRHGRGMAGSAGDVALDTPVPHCPGWAVRDVVRHTGAVHRWATAFVGGRGAPLDDELEQLVGGWPPDAELLDWFTDGHRQLVGALDGAPPDLRCWTFLPAPSPLAMWARRQAHETAIHRVDVEGADGRPTTFTPPFAADGIDEVLRGFVPRPKTRLTADPPRTLEVQATDVGRQWMVTIGPDGARTDDGPGDADCVVAGSAADLYLALWNRADIASMAVTGDTEVLDRFQARSPVR